MVHLVVAVGRFMKSVMRVLLIPSPPDPANATASGVARYLRELTVNTAGGSVEYVFAHGDRFNTMAPGEEYVHLKLKRPAINPKLSPVRLSLGYLRDAWRISKLIRPYRSKVDLVHIVADGCEVYNIAARLAGFRRIVTTTQGLFGQDPWAQHWVRRFYEWLNFRCAHHHIMVSEATYSGWNARVGVRRTKVTIVFNGMSPPDYAGYDRAAYRQRLGVKEPAFVIGICARLHWMKGHVFLLESCNKIRVEKHKAKTPVLLLIAGEGPERATIARKIAELGIGDHVRLLGHWDDPTGFAAAIDLNVLPSIEQETIGYQNIEAMFAGVPSVVSDFGGMKEIIGRSGGGRIVPVGRAVELCQAIQFYLDHPEERIADGQKAREFAYQHLTAESMCAKTLDVYREVLEKNQGKG